MIKKLLLLTCIALPTLTNASFSDMYGTRVEQLLGNPTARFEKINSYEQFGQTMSVDASIISPDWDWKLTMKTDMHIDKENSSKWNIMIDASWKTDNESWSVVWSADFAITSGGVYVKPAITTLPNTVSDKEKTWFQILDGKWIQINAPINTYILWSAINNDPSLNPIEMGKNIIEQVKTTPVMKSTKTFTRNGYEVHLIDLDPQWVEKLVGWVMNTMISAMWLPSEESLPLAQNFWMPEWIKTYGVIGQKWDEIKMGMLITVKNDPMRVMISTTTTTTTSKITWRVLYKPSRTQPLNPTPPVAQFRIDTETLSPDTQTTKIDFTTAQEDIEWEISIKTTTYDAWSDPITAPTGAITLESIMQ